MGKPMIQRGKTTAASNAGSFAHKQHGEPDVALTGAEVFDPAEVAGQIAADLTTVTHERDQLRQQLAAITAERDEVRARLAAATSALSLLRTAAQAAARGEPSGTDSADAARGDQRSLTATPAVQPDTVAPWPAPDAASPATAAPTTAAESRHASGPVRGPVTGRRQAVLERGCVVCGSTGASSAGDDCSACHGAGRSDACPVCHGSGWAKDHGPAAGGGRLVSGACGGCGGEGSLPRTDRSRLCDTCGGSGSGGGSGEGDTCGVCGGLGRVRTTAGRRAVTYVPGHGTFYRVGWTDGVAAEHEPIEPYAFRLEADVALLGDNAERAARIFAYAYAATVRGESPDPYLLDSPSSLIIPADTTKSRSDDVGVRLGELVEQLPRMLREGTPVRTTDRAGAGTAGTRAVEGVDPTINFTVYVDDAQVRSR